MTSMIKWRKMATVLIPALREERLKQSQGQTGATVTNCSVRLETGMQISAKDFQGKLGQVT